MDQIREKQQQNNVLLVLVDLDPQCDNQTPFNRMLDRHILAERMFELGKKEQGFDAASLHCTVQW